MNNGKVIIILGISGVGKTYYKNFISKKYNLYQLTRVITRKQRENEKSETDIKVDIEKFNKMKNKNEFFIYTKVHKKYYAYLNNDIRKTEQGVNVIGDCYYKLLKKLRKMLKEKLIVICIQPCNLEETINIIKNEREDYKQRIKASFKEYKYYKKHQDKIDYIIHTDYTKNTDEQIINVMNDILNAKEGKNEIRINRI